MGWGSGNLGGAGGGGLNFKVVQYTTTPTGTAKENTIGVVTTTDITGWVMQAEQPTGTAGLVWIEVAAESDVAFYADKKGMVKLYPVSVKQYVSGEWARVNAYIYQSGWEQFSHEWNGELYYYGDEFTAITGGWTASAVKMSEAGSAAVPTITKNADGSMSITATGNYGGAVHTADKISLKGFTQIVFDGTMRGSTTGWFCGIFVWEEIPQIITENVVASLYAENATTTGEKTLDISTLTNSDEMYYIGFSVRGTSTSTTVNSLQLK